MSADGRKWVLGVFAVLAALILSGCGGGGSSTPSSGTFYSGTYTGGEAGNLSFTLNVVMASGRLISPSLGSVALTGSLSSSNVLTLSGSSSAGSATFVSQMIATASRQGLPSSIGGTWTITLTAGGTLTGSWSATAAPGASLFAGSYLLTLTPTTGNLPYPTGGGDIAIGSDGSVSSAGSPTALPTGYTFTESGLVAPSGATTILQTAAGAAETIQVVLSGQFTVQSGSGTFTASDSAGGSSTGTWSAIRPTVTPSSAVYTWGFNSFGQLGNGSLIQSDVPAKARQLAGVNQAVCGFDFALAMESDGSVWAWGDNGLGEFGNGTTTNSSVPLKIGDLTQVSSLAAGGYHCLALKNDGTVWAWGDNGTGELGVGTSGGMRSAPIQVSLLTQVTAIAAGEFHNLAVKSGGTVYAWGDNQYGELGNGPTQSSDLPVQVSGLTQVKQVAAGFDFSLALKSDGTVWAWGDNQFGELGTGNIINSNVPVQVSGLNNATAIAAGLDFGLALKNDGTVWAWGDNQYGELGDGMVADSSVPVQVTDLSQINAIAAGSYFGLALKSGGTVWSWGNDQYGELGNGTSGTIEVTPTAVSGLSNASLIAGGQHYALAVAS